MTEKNLTVAALDKWMARWDNYFKKLLEQSKEALIDLSAISHPIQCLVAPIHGKTSSMKGLDLACGVD